MLDHLPDIESDMSVFHRIGDMYAMDSPKFFRLASRLAAYNGVLRAMIRAEAVEHMPVEPQPRQPGEPGVQMIEPTQAAMQASALADVVSFGQG